MPGLQRVGEEANVSRLVFADAHLRAMWRRGNEDAVGKAIAELESSYSSGILELGQLSFALSPRADPGVLVPVLSRGSYEMVPGRLAWARVCQAVGISRTFVRARLASGTTGTRWLVETVNHAMREERKNIARYFHLIRTGDNSYVIREMSEGEMTIPSAGKLWEWAQAHVSEDARLLYYRLSDYGHAFRYVLPVEGGLSPAMDLCASPTRKLYYSQGLILVPVGGDYVPLRLDRGVSAAKATCLYPSALDGCIGQSIADVTGVLPALERSLIDTRARWDSDPRLVLAKVRRVAKVRKMQRDVVNFTLRSLAVASTRKELTLDETLLRLHLMAVGQTDDPEVSNRYERVCWDLCVRSDLEPIKQDDVVAREILSRLRVPEAGKVEEQLVDPPGSPPPAGAAEPS